MILTFISLMVDDVEYLVFLDLLCSCISFSLYISPAPCLARTLSITPFHQTLYTFM